MATYQLQSTTASQLSPSALTGYTSNQLAPSAVYDPTNAKQKIYIDANVSPSKIDATSSTAVVVNPSLLTCRIPRHGENTASPIYAPPISMIIPSGGTIAKSTNIAQLDTITYAEASSTFYTLDRLWIINAALGLLNAQSPSAYTAVNAILQVLKAGLRDNLTPITPDLSTVTLANNTFVAQGSQTTTGNIGGGTTVVYCKGNLSAGGIVSNAGETLVIVVDGSLTFTNSPSSWYGSAIAGTVFIIASGAVSIVNGGVPATPGLYVATTSTFTYNGNSAYNNNATPGQVGANGLFYSTSGRTMPGGTFTAPTATSNLANTLFRFDSFADYSAGSTLNNSVTNGYVFQTPIDPTVVGSLPFMPLYPQIFLVQPNVGTYPASAIAVAIALQMKYQYGALTAVDNTLVNPNLARITSSLDGNGFETYVAVQGADAPSIPNIGVHTEIFDFDNYLFPMAKSYRVDDTSYTLYTAGQYMTMAPNGDVVFSGVSYTIPNLPYPLDGGATTSITNACTLSITDAFPGGQPSTTANQGGQDPYVVSSNAGVSWQSTYRDLSMPPQTTQSTIVTHSSYYDTVVKYSPLGGMVLISAYPTGLVSPPNTLDPSGNPTGILTIMNNLERRAKISYMDVTLLPTSATSFTAGVGATAMSVYANVANDLYSDPDLPYLTFANSTIALFSYNGVLYFVNVNNQIATDNGDYFRYNVTGIAPNQIGTLTKNTDINPTISCTLEPDNTTPVTITLKIIFGDMIQTEFTRVLSQLGFQYFNRVIGGGVVANYLPQHLGFADLAVNAAFLSTDLWVLLYQAGFNPFFDDIWGRWSYPANPIMDDIPANALFLVDACRPLVYLSGATQIQTELLPGTYSQLTFDPTTGVPQDGGNPVVVDINSVVAISDLPVSNGYFTYYGVQNTVPPPQPGQYTPGTTTLSRLLSTISSYVSPTVLSSTNIQFTPQFANGAFSTTPQVVDPTQPAQVVIQDGADGAVEAYSIPPPAILPPGSGASSGVAPGALSSLQIPSTYGFSADKILACLSRKSKR